MILKKFCLLLLEAYKHSLSPLVGRNCPYTPTCSMYAYDAILRYGAVIGSALAAGRLLRCNPFSHGGFDPVRENYRGKIKWLL